jgi:hypothetical protein
LVDFAILASLASCQTQVVVDCLYFSLLLIIYGLLFFHGLVDGFYLWLQESLNVLLDRLDVNLFSLNKAFHFNVVVRDNWADILDLRLNILVSCLALIIFCLNFGLKF